MRDGRRHGALAAAAALALSLAACLLLGLLALALASSDPAIPEPGRIVVLDRWPAGQPLGQSLGQTVGQTVGHDAPPATHPPPVDLASRVLSSGIDLEIDGHLQPALLQRVDADLLPLLRLQALHGDLAATLQRPDGLALSPGLVRQLWGPMPPAEALGRRVGAHGRLWTVGAILPETDPRHPLAPADATDDTGDAGTGGPHAAGLAIAVAGIGAGELRPASPAGPLPAGARVLARLRPGAGPDALARWLQAADEGAPGAATAPPPAIPTLADLPFRGPRHEASWQLLRAAGLCCGLLLVMTAINQANLLGARLLQRQRETALRRSLGADAGQLLARWTLDAAWPLAASGASALLLAWWAAPAVAAWLGLPDTLPVADPLPMPAWAGLVLTLVLLLPLTLAGPAWAALRRPPAPALQGRTASEGPGGRRLRQGLLTLQLAGAMVLVSVSGVLLLQQRHLLQADQGYEVQDRLWLAATGGGDDAAAPPDLHRLAEALDHHPLVRSWAWSDARPARDTEGRTVPLRRVPTAALPGGAAPASATLRLTTVSPRFFDTWGMQLLAGGPHLDRDAPALVIDAKAARALGFGSARQALGAEFRPAGDDGRGPPWRIVGVVADVRLESAHASARPQAFLLSEAPQRHISLHAVDAQALRDALPGVWRAWGPPLPYALALAGDQRAEVYQQEARLGTLLALLASLATAVAVQGAWALVADTLRRRRTEIVLRRLHGAADRQVAAALAQELAPPLAAAAIVALPLAAWLAQRWLAGFEDRLAPAVGIGVPLAVAAVLTAGVGAGATLRHLKEALGLRPGDALQ